MFVVAAIVFIQIWTSYGSLILYFHNLLHPNLIKSQVIKNKIEILFLW